MGFPVWLAIAGAVATPTTGPAEQLTLTADTNRVGNIHLVASASPPALGLQIVEGFNGAEVAVPGESTYERGEADAPWVCDRWVRTFRAVSFDGRRSEPFVVRTPLCTDRLRVIAPETVSRGGVIRVKVRDLWHQGATSANLCATAPGGEESCENVVIPDGQFLANRVFGAGELGTWTIRVETLFQRIERTVRVVPPHRSGGRRSTIVTTGDSLMLRVTTALDKVLGRRARVVDDVYPSAGLQKPFIVDWKTLPATQVRAHHQDATVLTLGIGDGSPLENRRGVIDCCGPDWIDTYAYRARKVMRIYSQGGQAAVVWLNVPFPEGVEPAPLAAVNEALDQAADGLRRVRVLDIASIFTPRQEFREWMVRNGRPFRVRDNDGVHLTPTGARIAARAIRRALASLGVATGR